jgi:signal transduction histidine kinase
MRTGYPVIVAMLLVVTSFATSLAYSHYLLLRIDERALAISDERMPRFQHIVAIRRALLQTSTLANEYIAAGAGSHQEAREEIEAGLARMRAELAAYRSLQMPQEEQQPLSRFGEDLKTLDSSIKHALDQADAGEHAAAMMTLSETAQPLVLRMEQSLERVRSFNQRLVRVSIERILAMRRTALAVAKALGLLSLLLTICATALVLYGLRSRARLAAERGRLLTERATELEAFAGRVAHDLRDPLNAASLRLESIPRTHDLDPYLRGDLDKASRQLERMRSVIDGLLDFARSGANPPRDARADLAVVLDEVVGSIRHAAEANHAELHIGAFPDMLLAIAPEALTSVLANLLRNAVKYVCAGQQLPHRIGVHVTQRPGLARIEIEDNGPGLPPGYEEWLFEPFRRLASKQPGTGLGLASVKRIVEAYQGRVGVNAELGKGSTFWFEIPLAA